MIKSVQQNKMKVLYRGEQWELVTKTNYYVRLANSDFVENFT